MLAHDLVNRMSVIVGYCDLSEEEPKDESKRSQNIRAIRKIAQSAAEELQDHLCHLDALTRIGGAQASLHAKGASPLPE